MEIWAINENTIIKAINARDKETLDAMRAKAKFSLAKFCKTADEYRIGQITAAGLEFLFTAYGMSPNFSKSIRECFDERKLEVCMKFGWRPSPAEVRDFATDERRMPLLFKYKIPIPDAVVREWTTPGDLPLLKLYLELGGNPNVANPPSHPTGGKNGITYVRAEDGRALIDTWALYYGPDCEAVRLLSAHGAQLSPLKTRPAVKGANPNAAIWRRIAALAVEAETLKLDCPRTDEIIEILGTLLLYITEEEVSPDDEGEEDDDEA